MSKPERTLYGMSFSITVQGYEAERRLWSDEARFRRLAVQLLEKMPYEDFCKIFSVQKIDKNAEESHLKAFCEENGTIIFRIETSTPRTHFGIDEPQKTEL